MDAGDTDFPAVLIGPSGAKFAILMGIMCFMTGGAFWVVLRILTGTTFQSAALLPLLICGVGGLVSAVWMLLSLHARLYGQPRLRIDATGIADPSDRCSMGAIAWSEIRGIRAVERKQVVSLTVTDKPAVLARMHPLRRILIRFDSVFAPQVIKLYTWRLDITREDLFHLLVRYHKQFGEPVA
ncbi:MAG: hypothetical protein CL566_06620 [Alphaproteobacteria bacterium]|nr:hypothetical protein [Alphaproteobacteria bacterium]